VSEKVSEVELVFLGTGGGRFITITQKRWTGGIRIISGKSQMHLDPGPGAVVRSIDAGLSPQKVKALLISHSHPDHYTDGEIFVEAMTRGMTRKSGTLIAPRSVLLGNDVCEASISKYHQSMVERVIEARPDLRFNIDDVEIFTTRAVHSDPDAVGFRFTFPDIGDFSYTSDTEYFDGIGEYYRRTRLLILCVMRPRGAPWRGHMSSDDAVKIVGESNPERAIITHFGLKMFYSWPPKEATYIEKETGVPTVAATDGLRVKIGKEIDFTRSKGR